MKIIKLHGIGLVLAGILTATSAFAQAPEYGPPNGTLVIQGGGPAGGTGIFETFIAKAGGKDAKILIVPTARGVRNADGTLIEYDEERVIAPFKRLGATNVHMLHASDSKIANTEEFAKTLRDTKGVWFTGGSDYDAKRVRFLNGRQWVLVDVYANTLTLKEFHNVLARGGVIGGSSAGASIIGDFLVRGARAGMQLVMAPEPEHQRGFNFLRHSALDQHVNTRNRWDDLKQVIDKYPEMIGLSISESTAVVVTGDRFEVIGRWKVGVHDNTRPYQPWEKQWFPLDVGDVYNMKTRRIEKYGTGSAIDNDPLHKTVETATAP